ncbi:MAG: hypothetical protein HOM47_07630 [Euryarchaeota archaeon]|nr:hypothetical protein [Euryarchaeota archaeon]
MGLLDKVDNLDAGKPAKAVPKKAAPKKVVPRKATAKKAVAKKATPVAAKAAKPARAAKPAAPEKIRPTGLPEGYELSGSMPRYIGWLINFAWNFGVLIATIAIASVSASDYTFSWLAAGLMIIINWLVIPIWMGRNIGEFVSRTKYINSSGNKPFVLHAVLNNSLGFMFLFGFIMIFMNFKELGVSSSAMTWLIVGVLFMIIWVVNFFFKKNSDFSQGLFDLAFSSYLVKHVASGTETGWMARFDGLGDFGDKWQQKQLAKQEKVQQKAEAAALASEESNDDSTKKAVAKKAVAKKAVAKKIVPDAELSED